MLSVHFKYIEIEFVLVCIELVIIIIDGLPEFVFCKERKPGLPPFPFYRKHPETVHLLLL